MISKPSFLKYASPVVPVSAMIGLPCRSDTVLILSPARVSTPIFTAKYGVVKSTSCLRSFVIVKVASTISTLFSSNTFKRSLAFTGTNSTLPALPPNISFDSASARVTSNPWNLPSSNLLKGGCASNTPTLIVPDCLISDKVFATTLLVNSNKIPKIIFFISFL